MRKIKSLIIIPLVLFSMAARPQNIEKQEAQKLITGAEQTGLYIPMLKNQRIGLVANHSSLIGETHLADTLLSSGIDIKRVFAPEHGFRGLADAGEHIQDGVDMKTGLPVISLYGKNRKPSPEYLQDLDMIVFDLQDVGVRFYTYISTLTYIMEAAADQGIAVIILDRPNPNGFYIDGPVMEYEHTSFVGLHQVPIVYGMTIGEYAFMLSCENMLREGRVCKLTVISLLNYDRNKIYQLPVKPSPNLPSWQSIYLYPSLCLFEGTIVSIGRGTDHPFTIYGHPEIKTGSYAFIPESRPGAKHPKLEGKQCYGQDLTGYASHYNEMDTHFNLQWLISAYEHIQADSFFIPYFEKLAGTSKLRKQIMAGMSQDEIKATWQDDIRAFKEIRKHYLLYDDFQDINLSSPDKP